MVTVGAFIKYLQSYDPADSLGDVLPRPVGRTSFEFVKWIDTIVQSKPQHGLVPRPHQVINALSKLENCDLLPSLVSDYEKFRRKPSAFWEYTASQFDFGEGKFLSHVYLRTKYLESNQEWNTIHSRFLTIFFHDLKVLLGDAHATANFKTRVLQAITDSNLVEDDAQTIKANIARWTSGGARYVRLSESLDDGAPILLPQCVSRKQWELELPLTGPIYDTTVARLVELGIRQESERIKAYELGRKIRDCIIDKFRWSHDDLALRDFGSINEDSCRKRNRELGEENLSGASSGPRPVIQRRFVEPGRSPIANLRRGSASVLVPPLSETSCGSDRGQDNLSDAVRGANPMIRATSIEFTELRAVHLQERNISIFDPPLPQTSLEHGQAESNERRVVKWAAVDKLNERFGPYLYQGIDTSCMREEEKNSKMTKFTDTVRLHLPDQFDGDIKLEIWLSSSVGKKISQVKMGLDGNLRNILGGHLFDAMKDFDVSFPYADDGRDCKIKVILDPRAGYIIWNDLFPRFP